MPRIVFVLQIGKETEDRTAINALGKKLMTISADLGLGPKSCFIVAPTDAPTNVGSISMDLRP